MKIAAMLMLCLALAAFAEVRSGTPGHNVPSLFKGTYTVEEIIVIDLSGGYGMAVQDDVADRAWIHSWSALENYEYDISTGIPTGNAFPITEGIDPDDQGYCDEYSGGSQWFFGHWVASEIGVFDDVGNFVKIIDGPGAWDRVCGVGAGNGFIYASTFYPPDEIGWGTYTGSETSVSWTTAAFASVSGMAVYGMNLFVCCQIIDADNIFIFDINPDGSVNMTPVWSCEFVDEDMEGAGGIDYDGEFLWLYPQNTDLYKLSIDWTPGALDQSTWGEIKTSF